MRAMHGSRAWMFLGACLLVSCADPGEVELAGLFPCATSADCLSGFACGPLADDPDARLCMPACQNHSDCQGTTAGMAVCGSEGTCVEVRTDLCATIAGDPTADNTIILGALTPQADYGDRELASVLAVQEFNEAGGVSGSRKLALIGCDDGGRPDQARVAARHLAALGVPALVGPYFSGVYIETFSEVMRAHGILTISPSATSPLITGLEDDGLAWRTISSDLAQAAAMAEMVLIEQPEQVVMLAKDDAYGNFLQSEVGGDLLESLTSDRYLGLKYPEVDVDAATVARQALDSVSKPIDVVVLGGTSEVVPLIEALEDELIARGRPGPTYVLSEGGHVQTLLELVSARPELVGRVRGTDPSVANGSVTTNFEARYSSTFAPKRPQTFATNAYDAVYVLGYALSTTTGLHPSGSAIAAGIARLVNGPTRVDAAPTDIGTARDILSSGGSVNIEGASGPLNFNVETGDTSGGVTGWHVVVSGGTARFESLGTFVQTTSGGQWQFDMMP